MNNGWEKTLIEKNASILSTIHSMTESALQVALVVDKDRRLQGIVTDGDLRLALLRGVSMESPVSTIMKAAPLVVRQGCCEASALSMMREKHVRHLPQVDDGNVVVGLYVWDELLQLTVHLNSVVIMAGGYGMRLRPLTETCPKPMLKVGGKPILETIIKAFVGQGFSRFFLAVNYLSEMIEGHFENGCQWGASISYLRENQKLGTAGPLKLLPKGLRHPLIVMNGDILTSIDFRSLLDFHAEQNASVTMCVRPHEYRVPFGVVNFKDTVVTSIIEKPTYTNFINAGIYVINPDVLDCVVCDGYLDMPDLLNALAAKGMKVAAYLVNEYWVDVGRISELEQANSEFSSIFV